MVLDGIKKIHALHDIYFYYFETLSHPQILSLAMLSLLSGHVVATVYSINNKHQNNF